MTMFSSQWLANPGVAYEIDQSCRFNDNDSAYLTRTPGSAGNRRTWTLSVWVKRGNINPTSTTEKNFFNAGVSGSGSDQETEFKFYDSSTGNIRIYDYSGLSPSDTYYFDLVTDRVFRDTASWYHLVFKMDTTQGTAADRFVIYANGETVALSSRGGESIYPDQNHETSVCDDVVHVIGKFSGAGIQYFDGYLAEMHLVDGTALTAASFGKTDNVTGQWVPIEYTGSYGTTGFYLDFASSSDLGNDVSGNNNDWTSSGLATADQVTDSPTDNYCVFNLLDTNDSPTFAEGNLEYTGTAAAANCRGTVGVDINDGNGYYFEIKWVSSTANCDIGIQEVSANIDTFPTSAGGNAYMIASYDGNKRNNGSDVSYGTSYSTGDFFQVAMKGGKIWFGKNNTWQASGDPAGDSNEAFSGVTGIYAPAVMENNTDAPCVFVADFGQSGFQYTPPTGFVALSTANIATPTTADPSAYFQTTLYTGNGSTQSIDQSENKSFEPDLVWIKNRDAADSHILTDSVRGATKILSSDTTAAEATDADTLTAFESNGFALGDDVKVNTNTEKYVAWQWLESTTSDFDIVSYTGNATNRTISHSLGVAPEMMIVKNLADTDNWAVYHASNTAAPATDYLILNTTAATADDATIWNDTAPTSSVFSVGTSALTNGNTEAMIAYLFASVEGFSKFESYEGNGNANGTFVHTGFRPSLIICKSIDSTSDWFMFDAQRAGYNVDNNSIFADTSAAELTADNVDLLSNGFKLRISTDPNVAETYVYAAFAHAPFKTANAR